MRRHGSGKAEGQPRCLCLSHPCRYQAISWRRVQIQWNRSKQRHFMRGNLPAEDKNLSPSCLPAPRGITLDTNNINIRSLAKCFSEDYLAPCCEYRTITQHRILEPYLPVKKAHYKRRAMTLSQLYLSARTRCRKCQDPYHLTLSFMQIFHRRYSKNTS